MFSGIVDHIGKLENIEEKPSALLFRIRTQFNDWVMGESIAVDGACLTVVDFNGDAFDCELSSETLKTSIAQHYQLGQSVNLERAMRLNDRLGGHLVTGHVEDTLLLDKKEPHGDFIELHFSDFPREKFQFLIHKGSVCINGVSLTVNAIDSQGFSVMLIPHTLEKTNLSNLEVGQRVNVEWDYVAKIILNKITAPCGRSNEEMSL